MYVWITLALLVLITVSVLALVLPNLGVKTIDDPKEWSLESGTAKTEKPNQTDFFINNQNALFRVFYKIESLPRTSVAYDSSVGTASGLNPVTNNFDICTKTNADACKHPGFIKLLNFQDSFYIELLQAPDASRPGLPKTQVCIRTTAIQKNAQNQNQQVTFLETFPIPPFPLQKWVMLSVVRRGSDFDIYYNDKMVSSIKTTNVPYFSATSATFADKGVKGVAKYVHTLNKSYTPDEVDADFNRNTDTNGEPTAFLFTNLDVKLCPSGNCFSGPQIKPANPLVDWTSDYN
jgi:hypothetical protein